MTDTITLSKRATLHFLDIGSDNAMKLAENWMDKWECHYRIVKEHDMNNDHCTYDILCSQDAYNGLPNEAVLFETKWEKQGIIEDSLAERKEYFEYLYNENGENNDIGEPLLMPVKDNTALGRHLKGKTTS